MPEAFHCFDEYRQRFFPIECAKRPDSDDPYELGRQAAQESLDRLSETKDEICGKKEQSDA